VARSTTGRQDSPTRVSDHPRAGGEHAGTNSVLASVYGSSPRWRGAREVRDLEASGSRIIPALAGSTLSIAASSSALADHPRAGGEHSSAIACASYLVGSFIPALAGSTMAKAIGNGTSPDHPALAGSTPNGQEPAPASPDHPCRIIPALAGSTSRRPGAGSPATDHPRAGGEHLAWSYKLHSYSGSSPRWRGARTPFKPGRDERRIIPALAGSTHR